MTYAGGTGSNISQGTILTIPNGWVGQSLTIQSGSGTSYSYKENQTSATKRIGPKLYFSYVKSKLTKNQVKKLKARLQKLQSLVKNAHENGQKALYEEFSKMLVVAVRESEAAACGYDVFINRTHIEKFMYSVTENDKSNTNPIRFKKLEDFPRAIPANISKKIKSVQLKGLFDELHVLYLDYTNENVKSTKEKIREKDPIIFGKFNYDPERFYFIADWIDEYCDLTLSKFVDALKKNDEEYDVSHIEDVSPEYLERIKKEIAEREERLKSTNSTNYRDKMVAEEKAAERAKWRDEAREEARKELEDIISEKDKELTEAKKPWYKRLF